MCGHYPCDNRPCLNGGTCVHLDSIDFHCQCVEGYIGMIPLQLVKKFYLLYMSCLSFNIIDLNVVFITERQSAELIKYICIYWFCSNAKQIESSIEIEQKIVNAVFKIKTF